MGETEFLLRKNGAFSPYWNSRFPGRMNAFKKSLHLFKYHSVSPAFSLSPTEQLYMHRAEVLFETFVNWQKGKDNIKSYAPSDSEIQDLKQAAEKLANMFSRTPVGFGLVSFVSIASRAQNELPNSGRGKTLMEAALSMRIQSDEIRTLVYTLAEHKEQLHNSDS